MNNKILIINSPLFKEPIYDEKADEYLPPIGLGYIATYLKNNGHENIEFIDAIAEKLTFNQLKDKIKLINPEFTAINIFSTNLDIVKELIDNLDIKTHIIIGGIITKSIYRDIMKWDIDNPIDIVYGDGEMITLAIVTNCILEKPYDSSGNKRFFIVGRESMYYNKNISDLALDRSFFKFEPIKNAYNEYEISIVASRGCVYNCAYCAAAYSSNKELEIRERSADSIIEELERVKVLYHQTQSIRVLDDLFLKDQKSILQAIDIFNNFDFLWRGMAHINSFKNVDSSTLQNLKSSGCKELSIGIESGSESILSMINKKTKPKLIESTIRKIFEAEISVKGYFILGFPDEYEEDFTLTYELAKLLKEISIKYKVQFRISVFQFRPYHGTELYQKVISKLENGIYGDSYLSSLIGRASFNFTSGNMSNADDKTLYNYLEKINSLNNI